MSRPKVYCNPSLTPVDRAAKRRRVQLVTWLLPPCYVAVLAAAQALGWLP